jgi:hypothetical protein
MGNHQGDSVSVNVGNTGVGPSGAARQEVRRMSDPLR